MYEDFRIEYQRIFARNILAMDAEVVKMSFSSVLMSVAASLGCGLFSVVMFSEGHFVVGGIEAFLSIWNVVLGVKSTKRWLKNRKEYREDKTKYSVVLEESENEDESIDG